MRAAALRLLAFTACGACGAGSSAVPVTPPSVAAPAVAPSSAPAPAASTPPALPPLLALDTLAARAPLLAPGMHEVARGDIASGTPASPRLLVRADAGDVCTRVAFVAEPPLHAWLTDSRGDVLADIVSTGDGSLGARGPVCVRKGDAISLRVDSPAATWSARFVAWASP